MALSLFSGALATLYYQWITWETYKFSASDYAKGTPYSAEGSFMEVPYKHTRSSTLNPEP
jgi:hypothetical protein